MIGSFPEGPAACVRRSPRSRPELSRTEVTSIFGMMISFAAKRPYCEFDSLPGTDIPIHDSKEPEVVPPKAVYSREPEYSEQARSTKYSATVEFIVVVGADGTVKNLQITKPAGMGLDEQAVGALSTWKFTPGTKDGNPAAVRVGVEVCFSLQTDNTCN